MAKYRRICVALTLALGLATGPALARNAESRPPADDPAWGVCAEAATQVETEMGLPAHVLAAVSLAETGRAGPNRRISSWPWTVHDGATGHYFATEQDAVQFVRKIRSQGRRSIDVGCMQVNLLHHPRAFTSVTEGFDPVSNLRYAASFLKDLALQSRSWEEAIAKYHTQNPTIDEDYAPKVLAFWARERRTAEAGGKKASRTLRLADASKTPKLDHGGMDRLVLASATPASAISTDGERAAGPAVLGPAVAKASESQAKPLVLRRAFDSAP